MNKITKIRLRKGDNVIVTRGRDKGKQGKVVATHPKLNKVTVEGINIVKKHQKPSQDRPQGGIVETTKPVCTHKLAIIDDKGKPSKIGYKTDTKGNKVRIFKTTGKEIK